MMLALARLALPSTKLMTPLAYSFHRKPRGSDVPTQSSVMQPFSINCLHDNPGSKRRTLRLGRGPANGKGYLRSYLSQ